MMRRVCLVSVLAGSLTLGSARVGRTAPEDASPEGLVARAVDAMNHDRLDEYAAAMHPDALKQFRSAMTALLSKAQDDGKADQILRVFPSAKTLDDLKKFDDRRFFADYLRGVFGQIPAMKDALAQTTVQVVGHVNETRQTTHVVYRTKLASGGQSFERVYVASLRKDGPKWAMLLSGDVEGMIQAMKQTAAGGAELPNIKGSQFQAIGRLVDGPDTIHVVYRMVTPVGTSSIKKTAVLSVKKSEPAWETVNLNDRAGIEHILRERNGL